MSDVNYDAREDRPCIACGQVDKAPRDQVSLADGNSVFYHMDCHVLVANCEVCKKVLETAGGHDAKGKKNEDLVKHLVAAKRVEKIFTTDNAADDGVVQ